MIQIQHWRCVGKCDSIVNLHFHRLPFLQPTCGGLPGLAAFPNKWYMEIQWVIWPEETPKELWRNHSKPLNLDFFGFFMYGSFLWGPNFNPSLCHPRKCWPTSRHKWSLPTSRRKDPPFSWLSFLPSGKTTVTWLIIDLFGCWWIYVCN